MIRECANRLSTAPIQADPGRVIGLFSPRLPLETLAACQSFITKVVGSPRWSIVDRSDAAGVRRPWTWTAAWRRWPACAIWTMRTCILLLGCNLERSHGVVGSYVRRGVLHRKAKLVKVNPRHTWLTDWTDLNLPIERGKDTAFLAAMLKYLWEMGKAKLTLTPETGEEAAGPGRRRRDQHGGRAGGRHPQSGGDLRQAQASR